MSDSHRRILSELLAALNDLNMRCQDPNCLARLSILLGLIARLRGAHPRHDYQLSEGSFCGTCQTDWPCPTGEAMQLAERRLHEVSR